MKKVFSSASSVIHMFAQRSQSEGRCSNVYFENDVCYSYGRHYVLGEFITNNKGELAIMINDRGYSNTTAKHIGEMIQATRQYRQFRTTSSHRDTVVSQLINFKRLLEKAKKPIKYISEAQQLFSAYSEYCAWMGVGYDEDVLALMTVFCVSEEEAAIYIKEAKAKAKLNEAEKIKNFMSYESNRIGSGTEDYVRVSLDGYFVETSQEVRITLNEAKVLYTMIKAGRDIIGHVIQGYTVLGLNGVLKVGCHHINRKNMEEIGEVILKM